MNPLIVPPNPRPAWNMLRPRARFAATGQASLGTRLFTFNGRTAIHHGLRALGLAPGESVLVPAYHCTSAVEPVRQHGAKPVFYQVRPDGSPDFEDLEARISESTRAVIAIHYFGFPQPIERFRQLCRARNVYLLEDCAHVFTGEVDGTPLGRFGDVSIFSWRKFLPLYDGGELVFNNPELRLEVAWERESLLLRLKVLKNVLDQLLEASVERHGRLASLWQLTSRFGRYVVRKGGDEASQALTVHNYGVALEAAVMRLPMSAVSRYLFARLDFEAIATRRRANYLYLQDALAGVPDVSLFSASLPPGICPLAFPFSVHGCQNFHRKLRARGIPASTWENVVDPNFPPFEFPDAAMMYERLMFVPVHQDLTRGHLDDMIRAIRESLRCRP